MDDQGNDAMIEGQEFLPGPEGENLVWFLDYLDDVSVSCPAVSPCSLLGVSVYPLQYANAGFGAEGRRVVENGPEDVLPPPR